MAIREDICLASLEDLWHTYLIMFYKVINIQIAILILDNVKEPEQPIVVDDNASHDFSTPNIYDHSFFLRTFRDLDVFPKSFIELLFIERFMGTIKAIERAMCSPKK